MNSGLSKLFWLALGMAGCLLRSSAEAAGQMADERPTAPVSAHTVPMHLGRSPVEAFRKLLAMNPAERENFLTNYPPANRTRILEKVQEYELFPGDLRELRLQMTELRWYLLPLLKAAPTNRVVLLKSVPEPYQKLVGARLEEWDLWPPPLKEEILEYESTMNYLVGRNAAPEPQVAVGDYLSGRERSELERKLERWKALPEAERQQMYATFQHYFELSEEEKQRILAALSEPQRQETERVLDPIEKWPKSQRQQYLAAFHQFESMSPGQRAQFMKNAERWRKMSEDERQAWRDLVKQISDAPPYPPGFVPPPKRPVGSGLPIPTRTNPIAAPLN